MKKYKVIDISWPINTDTVEYKNKGILKLNAAKKIVSDGVHETHITLDAHTGTHIDAPAHFIKNGKTIESVSFDHLIGDCKILDLTHIEEKITAQDLHRFDIQENDIILLKTKNSAFTSTGKFEPNFVYLDSSAASYLASKKIKTVGIDYLGIERAQPEHETHKVLFESNITIIEGLRLEGITPGSHFLVCLPIKLQGIEAAPVRAVLLDFE
jgi:arylformamidase